jgi:hypothetical protein
MLIPASGEIPHDARVWIFGYASLIWKPGFEYQRRVLGYVKGFARRFWQTNATHRGTPDKVRPLSLIIFHSIHFICVILSSLDLSYIIY